MGKRRGRGASKLPISLDVSQGGGGGKKREKKEGKGGGKRGQYETCDYRDYLLSGGREN